MEPIYRNVRFWTHAKNMFLLILILAIVATSGCMEENSSDQQEKTTVVVSILPQAEFVEKIGGEHVETIVMIPPGASPATYEPTSSQLKELSKAEIYVKVGSGLPFEKVWLEKIKDINEDMLLVNSSKEIDLRPMGEGMDPHVWNDPNNAIIMVDNIYKALVEIDPSNEETYTQNRDSYTKELKSLDMEIQETLENKSGNSFMVYHPAWGYFAERYDLNMVPIETEGKEASARQLSEIITFAKQENITVIFVQSQFSTQSAEAVAEEMDGKVVKVDPLARNYTDNMYKVTEAFREGLK
ncbi:metal ABC transporter solute-binding protein, Zn/Mn family [Methanohalophilus portucalensis]|uniref:Zinc ABC transporter substrate-binding protein n=3 Tax=Methanohalophilus portucalensis TaxID=39664 RepID=A0A1X7NU07_9EURY|nr:zinc ABC transporter substrate-binding protein [Methanohalophilus portucalensis]ATU07829.1 zinc ABC transporter substrate-binding protein [Methanohalophilus portucalensis]RNI11541.1 zinc ABC transporter substrate-binding protein [Methanohalophilus portucalensis FDF-1]SMH41624.1 zinc transport system substrate-binding protein [Methanohalophilus portucalensis FDF-1]